jgi:hypothetical protein
MTTNQTRAICTTVIWAATAGIFVFGVFRFRWQGLGAGFLWAVVAVAIAVAAAAGTWAVWGCASRPEKSNDRPGPAQW